MTVTYFGKNELTKELFTDRLIASPPPVIGVDVETISLKERQPIGFSIVTGEDGFYFQTFPEPDPEIELVKPLLNDPTVKKVFHNAPFDLRCFPLIYPIDRTNIADTNVMARLLGRYLDTTLSGLAHEVGMMAVGADIMLAGRKTMLDLPFFEVAKKCCNDSAVALALYHHYLPNIDSAYFDVEMQVIPILIDMSLRGIKVNQDDRAEIEAAAELEVEFFRSICENEDFNPASPQQVGYTLAKRGSFLPLTRSRKSLSTAEQDLEFIDDPLAQAVLAFRKANKLLTTYIRPLKDKSRIYTEYNLEATVGRISSSRMNMQNLPQGSGPGKPRYMLMPDSGTFTTGDYSQEHPRILAYMSRDSEMLKIYEEGGDIHNNTARELRIPRIIAKRVNNAMHGGATPETIRTNTKIRDISICSRFFNSWCSVYRDAAEWIKGAQGEGLRTGWSLPTLFGRRIRIPQEREDAMKRKSSSYPILGSDGEIMKRALIICKKYNLPLAVTVHDSITCDGDIEFPVEELENIPPLRIPFEVKQTLRWE